MLSQRDIMIQLPLKIFKLYQARLNALGIPSNRIASLNEMGSVLFRL